MDLCRDERKWSGKLAGFDVYTWVQYYSMEQTLRIE